MSTMQMLRVMQVFLLITGIKEIWSAREYHKQGKKKWAMASFVFGILYCAVVVLEWMEAI